jgi:DNA-binding transcriptional LysR family regulator
VDRFTEIELFVQTAELGTLSKAAEKLDISNAAASRHLAALESRLKVRLVERNTRRLALTNAGHDFYARCKSLLAEMAEAEASVNAALVEPTGTLTITATISFSMLHLAPAGAKIPEALSRHQGQAPRRQSVLRHYGQRY